MDYNMELSFQALGLYSFLTSKSNIDEISFNRIIEERKEHESKKVIQAIIKELTLSGMIIRVKQSLQGYGGFKLVVDPSREDLIKGRLEDPILIKLRKEVEINGVVVGNVSDELKKIRQQKVQAKISHANKAKKFIEKSSANSKPKKHGFVYVFKSENGRCKIGESSNPLIRLRTLRNASGENHEIIMLFKIYDCIGHERKLHKVFNSKRKHSEWFELNKNDIEYIENYFKELNVLNDLGAK